MAPQEWGGCIFKSCDISFENTPIPHAVSLALLCEHAVMIFCRALAYATTANVCLHLLMYARVEGRQAGSRALLHALRPYALWERIILTNFNLAVSTPTTKLPNLISCQIFRLYGNTVVSR